MALMPRYGEQLLHSNVIAEVEDDVVVATVIHTATQGNIRPPVEIGAVDSYSNHILELVGVLIAPRR
jgi:hypothetical protein